MECLISDVLKQIIGLCDISSLFCLQFVNKNIGHTARKSMKIINKIKDNEICTDILFDDPKSIERRYYRGKQSEIANELAEFGIKVVEWLHNLLPNWPVPAYSYAMDIETLELIHSNIKHEDGITVINNYCPPRKVLEWMILTAKPTILTFDFNELAINKHYDLLEKIPIHNLSFIDTNQYEFLCWMIDNNIPISDMYSILPFLAGGGKRYIISITMSSDGPADTSNFKCQNVGVERVKQALEVGYFVKCYWGEPMLSSEGVTCDLYIAAVEANNIELLDYLHKNVRYTSLENADTTSIFNIALIENNYEAMKWILEHYDINREIKLLCSNIKILLFLRDHGFIWDSSVYMNAIINHDLDLIKYFHENNVPWEGDQTLIIPDIWISTSIYEWTLIDISGYIVKHGNVEILQWAISHGCPLLPNCNIHSTTVPMIKFLTSLGYPPISRTIRSVAHNLDGFKWLCREDIQFNRRDLDYCVSCGSLDVNYWLLKHIKEIKILSDQDSIES